MAERAPPVKAMTKAARFSSGELVGIMGLLDLRMNAVEGERDGMAERREPDGVSPHQEHVAVGDAEV